MNAGVQLDHGLAGLGFTLSAEARSRLLQYLRLLSKWNRIYNLTAIREPSKLVSHHLLDSLAVLPHLEGTSVVDVGSGAGLPGIPLALARSEWAFALLDSNHKKAAFLRQAVLELNLENTQVVTDRAEHWRPVQRFDIVISRAFSDLAGFVDTARHLCRSGGVLAAMKGIHPDEELAQLGPEVRIQKVVALDVPGLRASRHLVLLQPENTGQA
jgi:16S rRNA (guanine527-N7)-methyltransferase